MSEMELPGRSSLLRLGRWLGRELSEVIPQSYRISSVRFGPTEAMLSMVGQLDTSRTCRPGIILRISPRRLIV